MQRFTGKYKDNEDGHEPITEVLVDGDIEIVENMKVYDANILLCTLGNNG